jgi:TPR repeat protein
MGRGENHRREGRLMRRAAAFLLLALSACTENASEKCGYTLHAGSAVHETHLCKIGIDDTPALRGQIGMEFLKGTNGAVHNCEKASYWLHTAAEQGDVSSLITLGEMYASDLFPQNKDIPQCVEKNVVKGHAYLRGAQYYIARIKDQNRARAAFVPHLNDNISAIQGELDQHSTAESNEMYRKLIDERP